MNMDVEALEPADSEQEEDGYEVERIIDMRVVEGEVRYRVRWKNYCTDDDTWEPEDQLEDCREMLLNYKNNNAQIKKNTNKVTKLRTKTFDTDSESDSDKDSPSDLPVKKNKKKEMRRRKKKDKKREEMTKPLPAPETEDEEDTQPLTPPSPSPSQPKEKPAEKKKRTVDSDEDEEELEPSKKHRKDKGKEAGKLRKGKAEELQKKMDTSEEEGSAPREQDLHDEPSGHSGEKAKQNKGQRSAMLKLQGCKDLLHDNKSRKKKAANCEATDRVLRRSAGHQPPVATETSSKLIGKIEKKGKPIKDSPAQKPDAGKLAAKQTEENVGSACVPFDSESEDEDLLMQAGRDSDPDKREDDHSHVKDEVDEEVNDPSTSSGQLSASLPCLLSSSDSSLPTNIEDKDCSKSRSPSKQAQHGPATTRVGEEGEDRWHIREEKDLLQDPIVFKPAKDPGPTFDTAVPWSPLQLFQLFFSDAVVRTIIDNTNAYAEKRLKSGLKFVWKTLTVEDFYIFLTILLFSGLVSVHEMSDYWKEEWPYNFHFPTDTMTRGRFEAIMWSLHLSNPEEDEVNDTKKTTAEYDRLFKIKPLYTEIINACKSHFQPYQNISIDERMVTPNAKICVKQQYMKTRPTKWGYKLFVLADSATAYTWNFFVHEGKTKFRPGQTLSYTSVMKLTFPLLDMGYTLFVDNFYTSPALFEELWKKNTGACGTIQSNLKDFPQTKQNDLPQKAERGDLRWIRKNNTVFVKWMDTRINIMCSTVHEACSGQRTIQRTVKEAGVWQKEVVPIPDAVADFKQSMGGVNLSNALIGYYKVHHKTMKWYKSLFFHFLDIAVVNSFLLHKELCKGSNNPNPLTQKFFREKLLAEMMNFGKASGPSPTPSVFCMPAYYGDNGTDCRRRCRKCLNAGIANVKTPIYCRKCEIPLCLTSNRNCFRDWHDNMKLA